jgi:hypothetical protein
MRAWQLSQGLRPVIPKNTHPKLADLLPKCWQQNPAERPQFSEITEILQDILKEVHSVLLVCIYQTHNGISLCLYMHVYIHIFISINQHSTFYLKPLHFL